MPQVTRSTSTPVGYVLATMQTLINEMTARMSAGWPILASDVVALITVYNQFVAHYHTTSDLQGIQTFGNLGVYSTSGTYVTSTTTVPSALASSTVTEHSVATQDTWPTDVQFRSDGLRMFVLGRDTGRIYQYTLSSPWDITTAVVVAGSLVVDGEDAQPNGIAFSSDGTKLYLVGSEVDEVFQYTLSTAWDVSTASLLTFGGIAANAGQSIYVHPLGTKFFVVGLGNNLYEYTMSVPWNISSKTQTASLNIATQETSARGVAFNDVGTTMYIVGTAADKIFTYALSTPWSLSTATLAATTFPVASYDTNPQGVTFSPDGMNLYLPGSTNDKVTRIQLTSPWDFTSVSITPLPPATPPVGISLNNEILASDINEVISFINTIRAHTHVINDVVS